ncbi:N5-carboxyaminoimidazole ribonucleotide mutase [archaeon BMS3Abin16]|nr:N5-carboxyaminoimidazole ribonucleotide mutase [archaeon BMS3Abin16]HDY73969.1 5-(carboxyamino)imidazole ribonucleotide mutase [Euryarchaeota archaeon]
MVLVEIIAGSTSDADIVGVIEKTLESLGVSFRSHVASAHREPEKVKKIVESSDASVFIGVAGLSAALPGVIASHTLRPVVGVPKDVKLGGMDSLLSIVQMPPKVPVATVGIDNGKNAAFLAAEILGLGDPDILRRLAEIRGFKQA